MRAIISLFADMMNFLEVPLMHDICVLTCWRRMRTSSSRNRAFLLSITLWAVGETGAVAFCTVAVVGWWKGSVKLVGDGLLSSSLLLLSLFPSPLRLWVEWEMFSWAFSCLIASSFSLRVVWNSFFIFF